MPLRILRRFIPGLLLASACFVPRLCAQQSPSQKLIADASKGDLAAVEQDLANGADVNAKNNSGYTALASAAGLNYTMDVSEPFHDADGGDHIGVVRVLLDHHAEVNARNDEGETPLMDAAEFCAPKRVVELLLQHGADVNAKDNAGYTALMDAAQSSWDTNDIMKTLLEHGAAVNMMSTGNSKYRGGLTALMLAAGQLGSEDRSDGTETVSLLLQYGADANARTDDSAAPILWAMKCNDELEEADDKSFMGDYHAGIDLPAGANALLERTNLRSVFEQTVADFQFQQRSKSQPECLRGEIVKLATLIKPPPAIPEQARGHFITGLTLMKGARGPQDVNQAIGEFRGAVSAAPWWGDAYRNLGVAEEEAGEYYYKDAIVQLEFYLDTNPPAPDARAAQDEIYKIEGELKLAGNH